MKTTHKERERLKALPLSTEDQDTVAMVQFAFAQSVGTFKSLKEAEAAFKAKIS